MAARNARRALLQACKQGALADVKACTAQLLAISNAKETNPPMKMAMGEAAMGGHTNSLRHLMASLPRDHWQGSYGPWDPVVPLVDDLPQEWRVAAMSDYVVYLAAAGGIPDVIQALLDAGLGLNYDVERIGSPLGIAILYGKLDLIRFLLAKGADPNGPYSFPPISFLNQAALLRSTTIMQLLLDHGAAVRGSIALQGAAEVGCLEAAELLLESGAEVNEVLRWNQTDRDVDIIGTPLHVAVRRDQEAMVEFLLRRGARQDLLDSDGATVKTFAAEVGCLEAAELLLESGAEVNEVLRWNQTDRDVDIIGTPLHVAVRRDQEAMVEFLLRRGARQDLLDGDRATVKTLAAEKGNPRIIRLLQKHDKPS